MEKGYEMMRERLRSCRELELSSSKPRKDDLGDILRLKREEKLRVLKENELFEALYTFKSVNRQERITFEAVSYALIKECIPSFCHQQGSQGMFSDISGMYGAFFEIINQPQKAQEIKVINQNAVYHNFSFLCMLYKGLVDYAKRIFKEYLKQKESSLFAVMENTHSRNRRSISLQFQQSRLMPQQSLDLTTIENGKQITLSRPGQISSIQPEQPASQLPSFPKVQKTFFSQVQQSMQATASSQFNLYSQSKGSTSQPLQKQQQSPQQQTLHSEQQSFLTTQKQFQIQKNQENQFLGFSRVYNSFSLKENFFKYMEAAQTFSQTNKEESNGSIDWTVQNKLAHASVINSWQFQKRNAIRCFRDVIVDLESVNFKQNELMAASYYRNLIFRNSVISKTIEQHRQAVIDKSKGQQQQKPKPNSQPVQVAEKTEKIQKIQDLKDTEDDRTIQDSETKTTTDSKSNKDVLIQSLPELPMNQQDQLTTPLKHAIMKKCIIFKSQINRQSKPKSDKDTLPFIEMNNTFDIGLILESSREKSSINMEASDGYPLHTFSESSVDEVTTKNNNRLNNKDKIVNKTKTNLKTEGNQDIEVKTSSRKRAITENSVSGGFSEQEKIFQQNEIFCDQSSYTGTKTQKQYYHQQQLQQQQDQYSTENQNQQLQQLISPLNKTQTLQYPQYSYQPQPLGSPSFEEIQMYSPLSDTMALIKAKTKYQPVTLPPATLTVHQFFPHQPITEIPVKDQRRVKKSLNRIGFIEQQIIQRNIKHRKNVFKNSYDSELVTDINQQTISYSKSKSPKHQTSNRYYEKEEPESDSKLRSSNQQFKLAQEKLNFACKETKTKPIYFENGLHSFSERKNQTNCDFIGRGILRPRKDNWDENSYNSFNQIYQQETQSLQQYQQQQQQQLSTASSSQESTQQVMKEKKLLPVSAFRASPQTKSQCPSLYAPLQSLDSVPLEKVSSQFTTPRGSIKTTRISNNKSYQNGSISISNNIDDSIVFPNISDDQVNSIAARSNQFNENTWLDSSKILSTEPSAKLSMLQTQRRAQSNSEKSSPSKNEFYSSIPYQSSQSPSSQRKNTKEQQILSLITDDGNIQEQLKRQINYDSRKVNEIEKEINQFSDDFLRGQTPRKCRLLSLNSVKSDDFEQKQDYFQKNKKTNLLNMTPKRGFYQVSPQKRQIQLTQQIREEYT